MQLSKNGFFSNGDTTAYFCDAGNEPSCRYALTMALGNKTRLSMHSFSKNVGIGSSRHDFVGDSMTMRQTSSAEQGCNDDSLVLVLVRGIMAANRHS